MARFLIGVLVGGLLGAGGTWYALEVHEADVLVEAPADAGVVAVKPKKKKKRRRKKRRGKGRKKSAASPGEVVGDEPFMEAEAAVALTPNDRQVVWRGANVSLGSRSVDLDGAEVRALSQSEIERGVGGATRRFVRCILDARGAAQLNSPVKVKFRVDGNGRVGPVRSQAARYLHEKGGGRCLKGVAKSLRFPATGAPTLVELPFNPQ